ncbi:MAG: hypothetical protein FWC21_01960 [Treponema sp.]|nr:hypothetical protein [Treponema sp.]
MNKKFSIVMVIAIAAVVLFASSCKTTDVTLEWGNDGYFGRQIVTPAKDFTTLGLVFTEKEHQFNPKEYFNGETFTYQALLQEAQKLGADAIINVAIDHRKIKESDTTTILFFKKTVDVRKEVWYGSALAIKFTSTLEHNETVVTTVRDGITVTEKGVDTPIINSGAGATLANLQDRSGVVSGALGSNSANNGAGGNIFSRFFGRIFNRNR